MRAKTSLLPQVVELKPSDERSDGIRASLNDSKTISGSLSHCSVCISTGDEQDPRDQNGNVIYDNSVTLLDTWRAMESLVDRGRCRAIGLSDISLDELLPIYESARIKPAVVQVEAHPYLPETELLQFCKENGVVFLAFAPLGHGMKPGLLEDPVISAVAARVGKTAAQVLLAWAVQRGTALLTTPKTAARARESWHSPLPERRVNEISRIPPGSGSISGEDRRPGFHPSHKVIERRSQIIGAVHGRRTDT